MWSILNFLCSMLDVKECVMGYFTMKNERHTRSQSHAHSINRKYLSCSILIFVSTVLILQIWRLCVRQRIQLSTMLLVSSVSEGAVLIISCIWYYSVKLSRLHTLLSGLIHEVGNTCMWNNVFVFVPLSEPVNRKQSNPSLFDTHRSPARRSHVRLVDICVQQSDLVVNNQETSTMCNFSVLISAL